MSSEYRPRVHPIVNPEHAHAVLRRIIAASDIPDVQEREKALRLAIADAKKLLQPAQTSPSPTVA